MKIIRTLLYYCVLNAHRIKYTCSRSHELSNDGRKERVLASKKISSLQGRMKILGVMERNGAKNINSVNKMIVHIV